MGIHANDQILNKTLRIKRMINIVLQIFEWKGFEAYWMEK